MKKLVFFKFIFIFLLFIEIYGQESPKKTTFKTYSFLIMDSPAKLFTMRQMDQNYISILRVFNESIHNLIDNKRVSGLIQMGFLFFALPITHEEGHRSILTANNIGSISQPFINSKGAAYVIGVTDNTLKKFRDNNLPNYVRLHTSGLESDYMLTQRVETLLAFETEKYKNVKYEYLMRKVTIMQYCLMGLFEYSANFEEETNELERDIVGHDIYGFARHLYRPTMEFYRYTKYDDLTNNEKALIRRVGYRSLLNLFNPMIIGIKNFNLGEKVKGNIGLGYAIAPFGDFIDENIWLLINNKYNIHFYGRQFQNESNWFWGAGISLHNYLITEKLTTTISTHFWMQPEKLDFFTNKSVTGGAIDLTVSYNLFRKNNTLVKGFGVDLGMIYKTFGFLPEEIIMDEHFGFRIGINFEL